MNSPRTQKQAPLFLFLPLLFAVTFLALCAITSPASANVGEAYGFGSRSAALSGAGAAAWGFEGFSSYSNPAGLPLGAPNGKKLTLSFGLVMMEPDFLPIRNVVVENTYVSDQTRSADVDTSYRSTLGQMLGVGYKLSESTALGLTIFLPVNQIAYLDTGEAFVPEYVLYRARTQRPQIEAGFGLQLSEAVRAGLGLHLAFATTANASAFLNSDPNKPSILRFSASMKAKAAPYLGLLFTPLENREQLTFGAVIRAQSTSDNSMTLSSAARLFGTLAALDFNFTALSALFYDPWTVELGTSWAHSKNARLYAQLDYQLWQLFTPPALLIQTPDITSCQGTSCGVSISGGNNPGFPYRNIAIPRIGEEVTLGTITYRLGYAYRPSFLADLSTGAGNYLDPAKHMISAGVGFTFHQFLGYDTDAHLDLNASYHALEAQHIEKTAGNEGGNLADQKIGAPGYDAGGKILGGGVSLSLAL